MERYRLSRIGTGWLVSTLVVAAVAGGIIWYFVFGSGSTPTGGPSPVATARRHPHVTAAQVLRDASRWRGRTVVVTSDMGERYGPHSFTVGVPLNGATPPKNRALLVVAQSVPHVQVGVPVQATGEVVRLPGSKGSLPYPISQHAYRSFRGSLALVARSVSKG
ncbi:MAG TPA: hypothetical protein VE088_08485 [Gaiellaceae bacterium]|nr:hypothetical protein [Gaiellaceae bacterium]